MSNIYNLLDFLKEGSWEMRDGGSSAPLSTWEISVDNTLRTIAPVSMTKNNNSSSFNPSPWIYDTSVGWDNGMLDFSSVADVDYIYRIKYSGTITKHPEITALRLADVTVVAEDFEDRGDHYYIESDIEQANNRYIGNPENVSMVLSFSPRGVFAGSSSVQDFEADIKIEVEISPPPPYDPPVYVGYIEWQPEYSPFYLPEEDCASSAKVLNIIPISGKHYIWAEDRWPSVDWWAECGDTGFEYHDEPDAVIDISGDEIDVEIYEEGSNYMQWGIHFRPAGVESEYDYWVLDMVADVVTEDRTYRTNIRLLGSGGG